VKHPEERGHLQAQNPPRPDDGFDWDRFLGDQKTRPWIFHGTSSVHEEGIRRSGLGFAHRPYDNSEVEEMVRIFKRHRLSDPKGSIGVLSAYTASTAREQSVSLTFDWIGVCGYAMGNRGGETLEAMLENLEWALDPARAGAFASVELDFLTHLRERLTDVAARHQPLVVAAELPREWFDRFPFFADKSSFESQVNPPNHLWGKYHFIGFQYPGGSKKNGAEFRVSGVSVDAIRRYVRLSADQS
jgi:hypothetical protein